MDDTIGRALDRLLRLAKKAPIPAAWTELGLSTGLYSGFLADPVDTLLGEFPAGEIRPLVAPAKGGKWELAPALRGPWMPIRTAPDLLPCGILYEGGCIPTGPTCLELALEHHVNRELIAGSHDLFLTSTLMDTALLLAVGLPAAPIWELATRRCALERLRRILQWDYDVVHSEPVPVMPGQAAAFDDSSGTAAVEPGEDDEEAEFTTTTTTTPAPLPPPGPSDPHFHFRGQLVLMDFDLAALRTRKARSMAAFRRWLIAIQNRLDLAVDAVVLQPSAKFIGSLRFRAELGSVRDVRDALLAVSGGCPLTPPPPPSPEPSWDDVIAALSESLKTKDRKKQSQILVQLITMARQHVGKDLAWMQPTDRKLSHWLLRLVTTDHLHQRILDLLRTPRPEPEDWDAAYDLCRRLVQLDDFANPWRAKMAERRLPRG